MAYTPNAATQAALAKSRNKQKLTSAEQALLTAHSKAMVADMAPKQNTGGTGPYDYGTGTTGGYGYGMDQPFKAYETPADVQAILQKYNSGAQLTPQEHALRTQHFQKRDTALGMQQLNPNELAEGYQNFQAAEAERKANGLAPRPMPVQFTQVAQQMGSNYSSPTLSSAAPQAAPYIPKTGSAGWNNLVAAGIINRDNVVQTQPFNNPYGNSTPTPQPNPGLPTPTTPTPVAGSNPTPVNTNPTAMLPFNPSDALPSAPVTVRTPNGGIALGNSVAGIDEGKLLAESELQKNLRKQTFEQQVAGRKAMLDELSGVLIKQQQAQLNDQMPGIYEDLNTRGLLRSSALGEKVGLEATKLARQTSEQLALQGITDRNQAINDISGISESYLGGRGSAMQRRFSLEDFDRQIAAGEKLGANALPQISQPSGKGSGALQGGLGGAAAGASVGGGPGALIGGAIGAIGGGKLGSK